MNQSELDEILDDWFMKSKDQLKQPIKTLFEKLVKECSDKDYGIDSVRLRERIKAL